MSDSLVSGSAASGSIFVLRGGRVMLDEELARLYGVKVKALNQAVSRNHARFPADFAFRLSTKEARILRAAGHIDRRRNLRFKPLAFTEHGAVMLASVLSSERAVRASIFVVRAFVRLRKLLESHRKLESKLVEFERRLDRQDLNIAHLVVAIDNLAEPIHRKSRRQIGFHVVDERGDFLRAH